MSRFFLILFLCAIFMACSSDDSSALNQWFSDQGLATSYNSYFEDFDVSVKTSGVASNESAHLVSSYAALGNVNGIDQSLYFGLEVFNDSSWIEDFTWKLRVDSLFYKDIYEDILGVDFPEDQKNLGAEVYWLNEGNESKSDSAWLEFIDTDIIFSADVAGFANTNLVWKSGGDYRDTLSVRIPDELRGFVKNKSPSSENPLRLMVYIKLTSNDKVLRISPPSIYDVPDLLRVAQKTKISRNGCDLCLHSGVRESLYVALDGIGDSIDKSKTLVFAQLIFEISKDKETGNELGLPVPVYVYSKLYNNDDTTTLDESYKVDTDYVNEKESHPNLLFSGEDTLKLQVTKKLRHYANSTNLPDTLFLMLGSPLLKPESNYFYNHYDENSNYVKVISDRSSFSVYDFTNALSKGDSVKLRLWYADYEDDKK